MQSSSMETSGNQSKVSILDDCTLKRIDLEQLATSDLQLLAAARGHKLAWQQSRAAVLAIVSDDVLQAEKLRAGTNIWKV